MITENYYAIADYARNLLDDPQLYPRQRRLANFLYILSDLLADEEYRNSCEEQAVIALFRHLQLYAPQFNASTRPAAPTGSLAPVLSAHSDPR